MQKSYNLVKVSALLLLLLIQNNLQAQNYCLDCQADVKVVTDKQVLLDKIEIREGITAKLNTNLYVSYRSGNTQKFWANLAIATAGVAVSLQLQRSSTVEGNNVNGISPLIPLGVSVATLPSIWKNRPRGVPQAGLWLQHRDTRGKLTDTWEQPISSEAKNSGELLSINIDKPLSAGTVDVYLQNGSKNPVYYWGYESSKNIVEKKVLPPKTPTVTNSGSCPDGYLPNGNGLCCSPFNGDCVNENQTSSTSSTCYLDIYVMTDAPVSTTAMVTGANTERDQMESQGWSLVRSIGFDCNTGVVQGSEGFPAQTNVNDAAYQTKNDYVAQHQNNNGGGGTGGTGGPAGCPSGFLPNGQGMCCNPFTGQCLNGGGGPSGDSNCIDGVNITTGNPCYDSGGGGVEGQNRYNMRDIKNSALISNCLKSLTNCLAGGNVLNKLQEMIANLYIENGGDFNLVFSENINITDPARFVGNSGTLEVNSNVQLNPNLLNSQSFEYGVAVILHESLHGIMELKGLNYGTEAQAHERMLSSYFEILVQALSDATGISRSDAGALTLNGFASVYSSNPALFAQKAQSIGLTKEQVSSVTSEYKNKTKGSNCN